MRQEGPKAVDLMGPKAVDRMGPKVDWPRELVADFLQGRRASTVRTYRQGLEDFARFVGAVSIEEAAVVLLSRGPGKANGLVYKYRAYLVDQGLAASTVNCRLAALRSFVRLGRMVGAVGWALEVSNLRRQQYRDTRGPGTDGVRRLLDRAGSQRSPSRAARDQALVRLMYDLALRRESVVSLDLEHLDLEAGTVWVQVKGRSERVLRTLPQKTQAALQAWLHHRGDEAGPIFTNFDRAKKGQRLTGRSLHRIVRQLGADLGINARPHGLRHSAITEALEVTNGNVRAVQKFAGHADLHIIERYDDNRQDIAGEVARKVAESA